MSARCDNEGATRPSAKKQRNISLAAREVLPLKELHQTRRNLCIAPPTQQSSYRSAAHGRVQYFAMKNIFPTDSMEAPPPLVNPRFDVAGVRMTRIWHCFGNYMHQVDIETVLAMLSASQTNVLPINTHQLDQVSGRKGLLIGFGGVHFDEVAQRIGTDDMVIMLNINHQTTARASVEKTRLAHALTGERVVKLEVLNTDLRTSNNAELIEAVKELRAALPELIIMPLLHNDYASAQTLVELGCPLLRVMGSGIGDGKGIVDAQEFERICTLPVPVVLDGGVRDADDYAHAHRLGAAGCLINSALFENGTKPEKRLAQFLSESNTFLS